MSIAQIKATLGSCVEELDKCRTLLIHAREMGNGAHSFMMSALISSDGEVSEKVGEIYDLSRDSVQQIDVRADEVTKLIDLVNEYRGRL